MLHIYLKGLVILLGVLQWQPISAQPLPRHNLIFDNLAKRWDEAMPLGNGMLGALIWQKEKQLRISLDRADLWDERKALDLSKFNFQWVKQQVDKKEYKIVQELGDEPYEAVPYPTKLPAAALEFDISPFGTVVSNTLDIATALNTVKFSSGVVFNCYIHGSSDQGYFGFENLPQSKQGFPELIVHGYRNSNSTRANDNSHAGQGLEKLGYSAGTITKTSNTILYRQPTYENHFYEVAIQWKRFPGNKLIGSWSISNDRQASLTPLSTRAKEPTQWNSHLQWWANFWSKSSLRIPDTVIEKQYFLEMYKLGCVARKGAPAITLQAIWTADNGSLPPWKGDFHNDLNTQLSYWPAYASNHLLEASTFTDWLWKIRPKSLEFTRQYFGVEGLNVPGVATLNGAPMGGWIQYSLSPTVSAWCAQHFYWQWKYSLDERFLKEQAYPFLHETAGYLESIAKLNNGTRKLPLSSSPEYHNNSIRAWFPDWTNFDLSLTKYVFIKAAEIALILGEKEEATHWQKVLQELPALSTNETGLTIAPGESLTESHRHLSQCMSIYPLALLDINKPEDKIIIENSLRQLEKLGTRAWCGYSFSWMASLYARAYQADSAVRQLKIFASNFCSRNSFHLNGDQKGGQYASATYRPFTLEGNFAFAAGVQELLLQSREGYFQVFPAVPKSWNDVSFTNLRAEGAFMISAAKENGVPTKVVITSVKGGLCRIKLPFRTWVSKNKMKASLSDAGVLSFHMQKGQTVTIENGYE